MYMVYIFNCNLRWSFLMFALVRMVIQSNFPKSNKKRDVKKKSG